MRIVILALLPIVLITGCERLEISGFAEKVSPTRDDKTFTMSVESIPESQITERCSALGVKYDAEGCAAFNVNTKHCTIYVVDPYFVEDEKRFAVIGHETWHCRFGEWHE